jgi:DNA end-binding protein Ku
VIRDAMRREGVAGLARVVLSSRERPLLIEPMGERPARRDTALCP